MIHGFFATAFGVAILATVIRTEPIPEPDQVGPLDGTLDDYEVEVMGPEEEGVLNQMAGKFIAPKCYHDGKMFSVKYQGSCYICGCFWDGNSSNFYSKCMRCRNCDNKSNTPINQCANRPLNRPFEVDCLTCVCAATPGAASIVCVEGDQCQSMKLPPKVINPLCVTNTIGEPFKHGCQNCICIDEGTIITPLCDKAACKNAINEVTVSQGGIHPICRGQLPGESFISNCHTCVCKHILNWLLPECSPQSLCSTTTTSKYPLIVVHPSCEGKALGENFVLNCYQCHCIADALLVIPICEDINLCQPPATTLATGGIVPECIGHEDGNPFYHNCHSCHCAEKFGWVALECQPENTCEKKSNIGVHPVCLDKELDILFEYDCHVCTCIQVDQFILPNCQSENKCSRSTRTFRESEKDLIPEWPSTANYDECYGHQPEQIFPHPYVPCLLCTCVEHPAGIVHLECEKNIECESSSLQPASPEILYSHSTPPSIPAQLQVFSVERKQPYEESSSPPLAIPEMLSYSHSTPPADPQQPHVFSLERKQPYLYKESSSPPLALPESLSYSHSTTPSDPLQPQVFSLERKQPHKECFGHYPGDIFPHPSIKCIICNCLEFPAGIVNLDCDEDPQCTSNQLPTFGQSTSPTSLTMTECYGRQPGETFPHPLIQCLICKCVENSLGILDVNCDKNPQCSKFESQSSPPILKELNYLPQSSQPPALTLQECYGHNPGENFRHPIIQCLRCKCLEYPVGVVHLSCSQDPICTKNEPTVPSILPVYSSTSPPTECYGYQPGDTFQHPFKQCLVCNCLEYPTGVLNLDCNENVQCIKTSQTPQPSPIKPKAIIEIPAQKAQPSISTSQLGQPSQLGPPECNNRQPGEIFAHPLAPCLLCTCLDDYLTGIMDLDCDKDPRCTTTESSVFTETSLQPLPECFGFLPGETFKHPYGLCQLCSCMEMQKGVGNLECSPDSTCYSTMSSTVPTPWSEPLNTPTECIGVSPGITFEHPWKQCTLCTCNPLSSGLIKFHCWSDSGCDSTTSSAAVTLWTKTQNQTPPECIGITPGATFAHSWKPCTLCICELLSAELTEFHCWSDDRCDSSAVRTMPTHWTTTPNPVPTECIGVSKGTTFSHPWKPCMICSCNSKPNGATKFHCWSDNGCDSTDQSPAVTYWTTTPMSIPPECVGVNPGTNFAHPWIPCELCTCTPQPNGFLDFHCWYDSRCDSATNASPIPWKAGINLATPEPNPANGITPSNLWTSTSIENNNLAICFDRSLQQRFAHPKNQCLDCTCIKINDKIDMQCLWNSVCGTDPEASTPSSYEYTDVTPPFTPQLEDNAICFRRSMQQRFAHPTKPCLVCSCIKINGKLETQCQWNPECSQQVSSSNYLPTSWTQTPRSTWAKVFPLGIENEKNRAIPPEKPKTYDINETHRCHYDGDIYHTKTGCRVCTCRKNTKGVLYSICEGGCNELSNARRNGRYNQNKDVLHYKPNNTFVTKPLRLSENITVFPDSTVMFDNDVVITTSGILVKGKIKLYGDGSIAVNNDNLKSFLQPGGVMFVNDLIITPDDKVVQSDGTIIGIDGRIVIPIRFTNDSVIYPDGAIRTDDGIVYKMDGNRIIPDGTVIDSDGIVFDPNVMIKNKNGIIMGIDRVIKNPMYKYNIGIIRSDGILITNESDFTNIKIGKDGGKKNIMISKPSGLNVYTNASIEIPNGIRIKGNNIFLNNKKLKKVEGTMISKDGKSEKFRSNPNRIFSTPEKEEECFPLFKDHNNICQKCLCSWTGVTVRKKCKPAACTLLQNKAINKKLNEGENIISRDEVENKR